MKIIAAIMDISFVKEDGKRKQHLITKVKKFLVYDPSKVNGWDIEKKVKDETD